MEILGKDISEYRKQLKKDYTILNKAFLKDLIFEDVYLLMIEFNLSSIEAGQILNTDYQVVNRYCRKYNITKTKEQRKALSSRVKFAANAKVTPERNEEINKKRKNTWENKSKEEMDRLAEVKSRNSKRYWASLSEEERNIHNNKIHEGLLEYNANQTDEEKQKRIKKFQKTWYSASEEVQKRRCKQQSELKKEWWKNVSEETLQKRNERRSLTYQNKTEEEKQEITNKINATKKKNNSFNQSKPEKYYEGILKQKFPEDIECQYSSEIFPFASDFYIKSKDLYIDLHFHWTHGEHPFDKDNPKDIARLEYMQSKNMKSYQRAISTWTDLDVRKDNITKENNVNRLVFYTEKDFDKWLEEN